MRVGIVTSPRHLNGWLSQIVAEADKIATTNVIVVGDGGTSRRLDPGYALLKAVLSVDRWRTKIGYREIRAFDRDHQHCIAHDLKSWLSSIGPQQAFDAFVVATELAPEIIVSLTHSATLGVCELVTEGRNAITHPCPGSMSLASDRASLRTDAVLSHQGSRRLLCRVETRLHRNSLAANVAQVRRSVAGLLKTALTKLTANRDCVGAAFPRLSETMDADPTLAEAVRTIGKIAARLVYNRLSYKTSEEWAIGLSYNPRSKPLDLATTSMRWLRNPTGSFLADPFPVEVNGAIFIFAEEFPYGTKKGHISVIALSSTAETSAPVKVLETATHLSFPFVFEHRGRWYMIPESAEANAIILYEAVRFPYDWQECRVLVADFAGIDTVLHRQGATFWLMTSCAADGNQDNNLHLFWADSLFGQFKPHRLNPVKTDLGSSRNAGRIFTSDGSLYRLSQNCTRRYGGSVVVNRIDRLDKDNYIECAVHEMGPASGSEFGSGLHTFNKTGCWTVFDGLRDMKIAHRTKLRNSVLAAHARVASTYSGTTPATGHERTDLGSTNSS